MLSSVLTLFPMGYGYPLFPMGGGAYAPLSKIPENGRLRLKLWIYNEDGLKLFRKTLNSSIWSHRFVLVESQTIGVFTSFDKMVIIFHRIMEMPQYFQKTYETKLY